jgi:CRISPR-associated protein Cst2
MNAYLRESHRIWKKSRKYRRARMGKSLVICYLAKVSAANVNASHTEGNVVVAKKVTLPDGSTIPHISGQAIRRML